MWPIFQSCIFQNKVLVSLKCGACIRRSVLLRFGSGSFGWGFYLAVPGYDLCGLTSHRRHPTTAKMKVWSECFCEGLRDSMVYFITYISYMLF